MGVAADALRRFWTPGLLDVLGTPDPSDIRSWVSKGQYQVYASLPNGFPLSFADPKVPLNAFAGEISRFSRASAESAVSISSVAALPKSTAWALVQWYYAAFYAAHALLRMCGTSLLQLDAGHASRVSQIAFLFGQSIGVTSGFHSAVIDVNTFTVTFDKILTTGGGSHEALWQRFGAWVDYCSTQLLSSGSQTQAEKATATRLGELSKILSTQPAQKYCWLSYVRNQVAYKHEFSAWFPYKSFDEQSLCVYDLCNRVPDSADSIQLPPIQKAPVAQFNAACRFIVALCFDLSAELVVRSHKGASFQKTGMIALQLLAEGKQKTSPKAKRKKC